MSFADALKKLQRAVASVSKPPRRQRKPAKRRRAPKPTADQPPRTDTAVEQLVERVHAELPEVFGPTPKTVLEMFGPWDFGTPSGRVAVELTRPRTVDRIAWASRGTDLSLCDGEPSTQRKTARRPGRPLAHLGADTTTGLER